ncbi:hypothetical protein ACFWCA_19385 [Streptomyces phaeochromogenes]|uniref:hypothetical protein n=1 Tax=Streptomyces phaeochromogenes TaxID=1923 RepID=UPI00367EC4C4
MEHVPAPFSGDDSAGPASLAALRPQSWPRCFAIAADTVLRARLHSRTRLTVMSWRGNQDEAIRVVDELVTNAVKHLGSPHPEEEIGLVLAVDEDETLLIAVTDLSPSFPEFEKALCAEATGFARVQQFGGELRWFVSEDGATKTVEALIRYGPPVPGGTH